MGFIGKLIVGVICLGMVIGGGVFGLQGMSAGMNTMGGIASLTVAAICFGVVAIIFILDELGGVVQRSNQRSKINAGLDDIKLHLSSIQSEIRELQGCLTDNSSARSAAKAETKSTLPPPLP